VHELAHQWVGDSLAVEQWQHIWLNEGFATYAEWMWAAYLGDATEDEIFDLFYNEFFPADATDFWDLPIGDPGTERLFDSPVYFRGAMTLHVLRMQVGDRDFLRILQRWAREQAGGNVTTDEFIALAEHVSHQQLDDLFDTWLFSTTRPELNAAAVQAQRSVPKGKAKQHVRDAVRPMLERLKLGHKADDHGKRSPKGLLIAP
jgi:aminopeptidase N